MKYKSSELELPPLGEIVVIKREETIFIGEFYLDAHKERCFYERCYVKRERGFRQMIVGNGEMPKCQKHKWAYLPKFKLIKKDRPPIGIEVLLALSESGMAKGYFSVFRVMHLIKGCLDIWGRENEHKKIEVEHWIELEAFDED